MNLFGNAAWKGENHLCIISVSCDSFRQLPPAISHIAVLPGQSFFKQRRLIRIQKRIKKSLGQQPFSLLFYGDARLWTGIHW